MHGHNRMNYTDKLQTADCKATLFTGNLNRSSGERERKKEEEKSSFCHPLSSDEAIKRKNIHFSENTSQLQLMDMVCSEKEPHT